MEAGAAAGLAAALRVVRGTMRTEHARALFNAPVDTSVYTDYLTVVQHPMDLSTISKRLQQGEAANWVAGSCVYRSSEDVKADLDLMFDNCMQYNNNPESDGPTRELCNAVKQHVEQLWQDEGLHTAQGGQSAPAHGHTVCVDEVEIPQELTYMHEDMEMPLRLLDSFTVSIATDENSVRSLEVMGQQQLHVRGVLRGDEVHPGPVYNTVLTELVDWCIHYNADKPSVWVITNQAWYKLLSPSAAMAPLWHQFAQQLARTVAAAKEPAQLSSLQSAVTGSQQSLTGLAPASTAGAPAAPRPQLQHHPALVAAIGAAVANLGPSNVPPATLQAQLLQQLGGPNHAAVLALLQHAGPQGQQLVRQLAAQPQLLQPQLVVPPASPAPQNPPPPASGWQAWQQAQLKAVQSAGQGAFESSETPTVSEMSGLPNGSASSTRKRGLSAAAASDGKRRRANPRGSYVETSREDDDENVGGWGWVPPKLRGLSAGGRRANHDPLKDHERRQRAAANRELDAQRVQAQRVAQLAQQQERERAADEARGPPPPPHTQFRLPSRFVPDMLMVWEFTQMFCDIFGLLPFPFWRLEAALLPATQIAAAEAAAKKLEDADTDEAAGLISNTPGRAPAALKRPGLSPLSGRKPPVSSPGTGAKDASSRKAGDGDEQVDGDADGNSSDGSPAANGVANGDKAAEAEAAVSAEQKALAEAAMEAEDALRQLRMQIQDERKDFPLTDPAGAASASLLRDVHNALCDAAENRSMTADAQRKRDKGEAPPNWAWVGRAAKVIYEAPLSMVSPETKAIAAELMYSDYNLFPVEDRCAILAALLELAVNSDMMRDTISSRVDGEFKAKAAAAVPQKKGRQVQRKAPQLAQDLAAMGVDNSEVLGSSNAAYGGAPSMLVDDWMTWMDNCRLGVRNPLGEDRRGRRYWVLGGRAGCWRVYVEDQQGKTWGFYEGVALDDLCNWLRSAGIEDETAITEALERVPRPPPPYGQDEWSAAPSEEELDALRPDAYRHLVNPLLRGDSNWPSLTPAWQDKLLHGADALLTAIDFWFKGQPWLLRHLKLLDQTARCRRVSDVVDVALLLDDMLIDGGFYVPTWEKEGRRYWRSSVQQATDPQEVLLHLATLQDYGRWYHWGVIPRHIFTKLEQEVRCTLWVPPPGERVVVFRTGLLRHVDRYMRQLYLVEPVREKTKEEEEEEQLALRAEKERERLEKERIEQERLEAERAEKERLEQQRREQERLERERLQKEREERQRQERERMHALLLEQQRQQLLNMQMQGPGGQQLNPAMAAALAAAGQPVHPAMLQAAAAAGQAGLAGLAGARGPLGGPLAPGIVPGGLAGPSAGVLRPGVTPGMAALNPQLQMAAALQAAGVTASGVNPHPLLPNQLVRPGMGGQGMAPQGPGSLLPGMAGLPTGLAPGMAPGLLRPGMMPGMLNRPVMPNGMMAVPSAGPPATVVAPLIKQEVKHEEAAQIKDEVKAEVKVEPKKREKSKSEIQKAEQEARAAEAAAQKAAADAAARKEAKEKAIAAAEKAYEEALRKYRLLQGNEQYKKLQDQWVALRETVVAHKPVQRYEVASIAYRRYRIRRADTARLKQCCRANHVQNDFIVADTKGHVVSHLLRSMNSDLAALLGENLLDPASWPVCWILLRPIMHGPRDETPSSDDLLAVPLHVDVSLPDYMAKIDVYQQRMRKQWEPDDRFRMFFAVTKTTHNKLTSTGTYFRGTVLEVYGAPESAARVPWDPWESVLIQWDPTTSDEGSIERVNPWEIDVDPEEEKRREEERRKAEEAAARAARIHKKARQRVEYEDFDRMSDSASPVSSVQLSDDDDEVKGRKRKKKQEDSDYGTDDD